MKIRLLERLVLRVGSVLILLAGGVTVAGGVLLFGHDLGEGVVMKSLPLALIIAGAVTVLFACYCLVVLHRYHQGRKAFVTQPTELGELRIAVPAIENLILQCVETHKEVKVQKMRITNRRGAINVEMLVSMNSNVSIPHAVEQLQTQIKRYLAASSGIDVRDISVSVERAVGDKNALPSEPLTTVPEEKAEEKIPVHQRIFGRDPQKPEAEQVAESELIPPPETEPAEAEAPAAEAQPAAAEEAPAEEEKEKTDDE
ncbi:MAG: alkaline shock response membrane anchor protein AmaP [Clostridia bacterium]|nr:alkaline shock response membrane anchor protein AmaP [Clostridia bacterium]